MTEFITYRISTGQILSSGFCPDHDLEHQARPDEGVGVLVGKYDYKNQYVESGVVLDMPPKPGDFYVFNYTTKQWDPDTIAAGLAARNLRQSLLSMSDWTDTASAPTRLGQGLYGQWQTYRQALRDITSQAGFPTAIVWPKPPT